MGPSSWCSSSPPKPRRRKNAPVVHLSSPSVLLLLLVLTWSSPQGCHAQDDNTTAPQEAAAAAAIVAVDAGSWTSATTSAAGDNNPLGSRTAAAQLAWDRLEEALLVDQTLPSLTLTGLRSLDDDDNDESTTTTTSITYLQSELSITTLDDGSHVHTWKGSLSSSSSSSSTGGTTGNSETTDDGSELGVATLLRQADGRIFANFGTRARALALRPTTDGTDNYDYQITETLWKNVPDEGEAVELPEDGPPPPDDSAAVYADELAAPLMTVAESSTVPTAVETVTVASNAEHAPVTGPRRFLRGSRRQLQQDAVVDVLVLVTRGALCESAGLDANNCGFFNEAAARSTVQGTVAVAVQETNAGFAATDVPVQIRVARIDYLDPSYDRTLNSNKILEDLRTNSEMVKARADTQADLVSIVTASNDLGGLAYKNGYVSAVAYRYFSIYTFQHELLHNFGCDHDRGNTPFFHPYGHGYQVENQLRTVMSYRCDGAGDTCPRIPFPSANGYQHKGVSIGDSSHDNARMARENAQRMSRLNGNDDGDAGIVTTGVQTFLEAMVGFLVALCAG